MTGSPFDHMGTPDAEALVTRQQAERVLQLPHDAAHGALARTVIALHDREPFHLARIADALTVIALRDTFEKTEHREALAMCKDRLVAAAGAPR